MSFEEFKEWIKSTPSSYQYQLLDRMRCDCLSNSHFWGHKDHFKYMRYLYSIVPETPEWLSLADIEKFEKELTPF